MSSPQSTQCAKYVNFPHPEEKQKKKSHARLNSVALYFLAWESHGNEVVVCPHQIWLLICNHKAEGILANTPSSGTVTIWPLHTFHIMHMQCNARQFQHANGYNCHKMLHGRQASVKCSILSNFHFELNCAILVDVFQSHLLTWPTNG